jgi:hypothetical protein
MGWKTAAPSERDDSLRMRLSMATKEQLSTRFRLVGSSRLCPFANSTTSQNSYPSRTLDFLDADEVMKRTTRPMGYMDILERIP